MKIDKWTMDKWIEKWHPLVVAIVLASFTYFLEIQKGNVFYVGLLGALATVGSILAGLTGMGLSALLTVNSPIVDDLKIKGHFRTLMGYVQSSVVSALLLMIGAIAGFFITLDSFLICGYKLVLSFLFWHSVFNYIRLTRLLAKIARHHRHTSHQED